MNVQKGINPKLDRAEAKVRRREAKKHEIAQSAISALKTYGYAQTTLRDIAAQSDMSLGMMHYYFDDKEQLLIYCVRLYKRQFVVKLRGALDNATAEDGVIKAFAAALSDTLESDAEVHRLWYDIRSQAMFDPVFQPVVTELEQSMADLLRGFSKNPDNAKEAELLYAQVDGVFRYLLQQVLFGQAASADTMRQMLEAPLRRAS